MAPTAVLYWPEALEMYPIAVASSADATAPLPKAEALASEALELVPAAMAFVPVAVATGPIATESVPVADESAAVELAWKYLMPPPVLMLLIVLPRLVMSAVLAAIAVVFCVTCWLVANSCEPLMASVDELLSRPAATLVIVRSAPSAPTLTVLVGVVPAKL
ncbi:Tash protein PEST motif family [Mesorhizobium sp. LSJC268A00]|nr:Tash protein PEST motif family [Mesorhizobium sp. LSJC268A00]